jgi:biopolymer transport protein ExbD
MFNRDKKLNFMIKNIFYLSFVVVIFFTISCKKQNGKWKDNIKLSQKTVSFNANANSIVVTTESTGWWLDGITYNNTRTDLTSIKRTDQNFVVTHSDFQVERKDGNQIIVTMNKNTTNADRLLSIGLQSGDYFDGLEITQSK